MRSVPLAALCLVSLAFSALAQAPTWSPPDSLPKGEDWILISSGEWLRGEIDFMRDEDLQFDSSELDEQTFSWSDIAGIRSGRELTYVLVNREVVTGVAKMADGVLEVGRGTAARRIPRGQLLSIIPGVARESDYWSLKASLGFVGRAGNTEQTDLNTRVALKRAAPITRTQLDYVANLGEVFGERTINNHSATAKIDAFISPRFYITLASINLLVDKFQNIDARVTPSAGLGYRALRKKKMELDLEIRGGYQYTRFVSVAAGEDETLHAGTITPGLRFEFEMRKSIEFDLTLNANIGVPDPKESFYHALSVLAFDITSAWEFEISQTWDRVENPKPDADGIVPVRDDFRTSFGVSVTY